MTLKEMAAQYRQNQTAIKTRIKELTEKMKESESRKEVDQLKYRIKMLDQMCRECSQTANILEHYYDYRDKERRKKMYEKAKEAIAAGNQPARDLKRKLDYFWLKGDLTDGQYDELKQMVEALEQ